jgi:hypothetical protein
MDTMTAVGSLARSSLRRQILIYTAPDLLLVMDQGVAVVAILELKQ